MSNLHGSMDEMLGYQNFENQRDQLVRMGDLSMDDWYIGILNTVYPIHLKRMPI